MTREEAIKKRDEQIADIREWVRDSDDAWEYGAVLSVIDEIVEEIKICDKHIEALQERPKAQWLGVDSRYCKCTNCGILADFNLAEYYPVCPQCEAEMWNGRKKW